MNFRMSLSVLLVAVAIYSCSALRVGFTELDYVSNEGDAMAKVVLSVSDSGSQNVTIPLVVVSFDEFFRVMGKTLPSEFTMDLPDEAECK